ncbi:MAG: hypothetical protein ACFFFT_20135 [Candidatus Thorarchaeota archaeon]
MKDSFFYDFVCHGLKDVISDLFFGRNKKTDRARDIEQQIQFRVKARNLM